MNTFGFHFRVFVFALMALSLPAFASAQENKESERERQEILKQLHPEPTEKETPDGITLLRGYKHKGATDFEGNVTGEIWKKGGLKFTYAMGFSWGQEADPKDRDKYLQYSEQVISGRVVRVALTKEKLLIVSVPLGDNPGTMHAANFSAKVLKPEDAADMVTMALSLIQKK